jgi:hypothetical protein
MGLTANQMRWAMQHDWYNTDEPLILSCDRTKYIPSVIVRETYPDGYMHEAPVSWIGTMEELKAWAGY